MSVHTSSDHPEGIEVRLFGGPVVFVGGAAVKLSKYQSYLVALVFGGAEEAPQLGRAARLR